MVSERVGEEMVLLHLERGTTFRLNHTGMLVWEAARQGRSYSETTAALAAEFTPAPATLEADVASVLHGLLEHGLLVPSGEAA